MAGVWVLLLALLAHAQCQYWNDLGGYEGVHTTSWIKKKKKSIIIYVIHLFNTHYF